MAQTHHYLFDTATGFADSTGSDNFVNTMGTINASGKINQGFRFEYLGMMPTSTANNLLPTSGAFTIAFWMNENFGGYYLQLFNIGDMNVGLFGKDNELTVGQTGSGSFQITKSGGSYAHYIISTNGSGTWTVYKNNVSQTLTGTSNWTPNATTYNSTSDFSFNGGGYGDPVFIDDLRIYNEVIDSTERAFIYNSGSGTQSDSGGGGGGSATQLSVLTQPTRSYSTKNIPTQPVINLLTSGGTVDGAATNTVFANVVSGAGTIGGSTSVSATSGVATFSGLSVTGFGPIGLGFTASGLTAAYATTFTVDPVIPIMPQRTETSGYVPVSGDLRVGELFINIPDQKGYVKKLNGTIATVWQAGSSLTSGQVTSGLIGNNAVNSGNISSGTVGNFHIANNAVQSGNIASGQIGVNHLISGLITTLTLGSGQVTSGSIASGSISNFKIASGAISSGHVGNNSIVSGSIASGSISNFKIASGAISSGHVGNNSIVSGSIASGQITTNHLSNAIIVSGNIASGQVGRMHLSSGTVNSGHLANNSVVSGSISSGQSNTYHIGSTTTPTSGYVLQLNGVQAQWNALASVAIASGAISSGMLANNSVVSGSIASGQIGVNHLISGLITTLTLGSGQVTSGNIASGQIGNFHLSSGAVTSGDIGNAAVVSGSVASGQIGVNHLISGLITTLTLGSGQVTSGSIASGAISNFKIASGAIISGHIGDNAIVSGSVASGQIGTNHLANSSVVSGSVASGQIGRTHISSGAISSGHLANNSVVSGSIASGSINTYHIGSTTTPASGHILQLNGTSLQYNAPVTITSGSITSGMLGNNSVVSGSISSGLLNYNYNAGWEWSAYSSGSIQGAQSWTSTTGINTLSVNLAYGNGTFVGFPYLSTVGCYSRDGINWNSSTTASAIVTKLVYGNGIFMTVATTTGYTSVDGATWQTITTPAGNGDITYGNGRFFILSAANGFYSSADNGATWSSVVYPPTLPASGIYGKIVYCNGIITVLGSNTSNNDVYITNSYDNGATFTPYRTQSFNSTYIGGNLVANGSTIIVMSRTNSSSKYAISKDSGITWNGYSNLSATVTYFNDPVFGNGIWVAAEYVGTQTVYSTDGLTWTGGGALASHDHQVGYGQNKFVVIAREGSTYAVYSTANGSFNFATKTVSDIDNVIIGRKDPQVATFQSVTVISGLLSNSIANNAITSGKVASGQVGQFHLSDNSVRSGNIASGQIGQFHLSSGAVTSGDIGNAAVVSGSVASGQISNFHLSDNSVFSGNIASGQISNFKMSSGSVLSGHIGNAAVVSGSVASGQISNFAIASGAILSGHIGNGSVVSGSIASGQIVPSHFNQIIANNIQPKTNNFRLSVQSGVAITSTDQSAQSTLYLVPYTGNQIALYDGTNWNTSIASGAVVSLAITGLTSGLPYDVFAYDNSGVPALEFGTVWSTVNTRADSIQFIDGIALKSGTTTRRLVGTILPTAPTTTNDTAVQRYVNNYDNQVSRQLFKTDATNHTYASNTNRIWNLSSGNQIQFVASKAGIAGNVGMQTASRVSTGASFARTQVTGGAGQLPSTSLGVATLATSGALLQYMTAPSASYNSVLGYNFFYPAESCTTLGATGTFNAMDLFGEIKG